MTVGYQLGTVTVAGRTLSAVRMATGQLKYQTWCSGMWLDADPITRDTFTPKEQR